MKNLQEVTVPMGKDIKKVITEFILQNGWKQVYIIGAVGSVIDMVFTTPIQNYLPLKVSSVPVHDLIETIFFALQITYFL